MYIKNFIQPWSIQLLFYPYIINVCVSACRIIHLPRNFYFEMNIMVAMAETVDPGDSFTSNSYSVMRLGASWDLKFEESLALTHTMNSKFL